MSPRGALKPKSSVFGLGLAIEIKSSVIILKTSTDTVRCYWELALKREKVLKISFCEIQKPVMQLFRW